MGSTEVLCDTNSIIGLQNGSSAVIELIDSIPNPAISVFTWGELQYGAAKSARPDWNRSKLATLLQNFRLILPDRIIGEFYGSLNHSLRRKGRPIPINDVWIAALALQHTMPVLTRDAHFREVEGIDVIGW